MELDHIVYIVPDLQEAIQQFKESLGCIPRFGGKHENLGTHNAILGFKTDSGNKQYLELLAINPEDETSRPSYPLGLTNDLERPTIAGWAAKCETIEKVAEQMKLLGKAYDPGAIITMSRTKPDGAMLRWKYGYNKTQTDASNGVIPFLIDWGIGPHPTDNLNVDEQCECYRFTIRHPFSELINENLKKFGLYGIKIEPGSEPRFELVLNNDGKTLVLL